MKTTVKRLKPLNEVIEILTDGTIVIDGHITEPTDLQIAQAIRKYARQYNKVNEIQGSERFMLKNAHPMVSDVKGTVKSKDKWMEDNDWSEEKFMTLKETAVLVRR